MLHDKANWPTINLPSARGAQGSSFAPSMGPRNLNAAATGQPVRMAPDRAPHHRRTSVGLEPKLEEEEDVSRGDLLDFMTPRDISKMRYEQHHEWMEEIMASPFAMKQIIPSDLGLGRKGELEALTGGFFDSPTSLHQEAAARRQDVRVGRMELGRAEEFTAQATRKVAEMEAELANLRKQYAKRTARLGSSSALTAAEKRLRSAPLRPGRSSKFITATNDDDGGPTSTNRTVDEVVSEVEHSLGKKIVPVTSVQCMQKGGLEPEPSSANGELDVEVQQEEVVEDKPALSSVQDGSLSNELAGVYPHQQNQTNLPASTNLQAPSQPQSITQPAALSATNGLPSHSGPPLPPTGVDHEMASNNVADALSTDIPAVPSLDDMDIDIEMAGLINEDSPLVADATGAQDSHSEWVMVDSSAAAADGQTVIGGAVSAAETAPPAASETTTTTAAAAAAAAAIRSTTDMPSGSTSESATIAASTAPTIDAADTPMGSQPVHLATGANSTFSTTPANNQAGPESASIAAPSTNQMSSVAPMLSATQVTDTSTFRMSTPESDRHAGSNGNNGKESTFPLGGPLSAETNLHHDGDATVADEGDGLIDFGTDHNEPGSLYVDVDIGKMGSDIEGMRDSRGLDAAAAGAPSSSDLEDMDDQSMFDDVGGRENTTAAAAAATANGADGVDVDTLPS